MSQGFKIYTKGGDKGTSVLFTGDRLPKNSEIFDCLGAIDELSAHLGLAREHILDSGESLEKESGGTLTTQLNTI